MRFSNRILKASLMGAAAIGALATGALAQPNADEMDDGADVITVYGTTNPLPALNYPGQVSVIDREEIETLAPSSLSDVLRDVPGIEFSGGPRRTGETPSIRGLSGQNVLILLDGARQSFISAHDGRFFVDPDLIGTVEVVRGPASALYGSGAVGGVLALETVDADDLLGEGESVGLRGRIGYQSVNEETQASVTAYTKQEKLDLLASFGVRQSGDIELGTGVDLASDDDLNTALVKVGYQLTDAFEVEGSWQRFENTAIEPNNGQGVAGTGDSILDRDVEKDIQSDSYRLGLAFDPSSDLINSSLTIYQTTSSVEEFDQSVPRTTIREIETTGVSLRNASLFQMGQTDLTFTLGGDWYTDEQVGTDSETADGSRGGVPNGQTEFTGLFAQIEAIVPRPLGLPGELVLIPSIRYDEFESEADGLSTTSEDDAVSPRYAASYGPVPWFRVFASYSEGFRAPSINELFLEDTHFPVPHPILFDPMMGNFTMVNNNFVPNPDLVPEKTETTEYGVGVDFKNVIDQGDRFQGKVSHYESDVEDLINLFVDFAYDPTCFSPPFFPCTAGTTSSVNVDDAELDGIEAEFRYDSDRWFAKATYSSVDGTNAATGEDLGTLTPDRTALHLGWKLPAYNLTLGTRAQFADDFERRGLNDLDELEVVEARDGYSVVDVYATWRPAAAEGLRIDMGIDNLFDEDYERVFEGVSEPAQNVKISATWEWGR